MKDLASVSIRESLLAPYAQKATESAGRLRRETEHSFRTCFQRDRDRIIHGTSFRRLDGKTQVFLNGKGDHYRTRLTHTIEVASISRTVARALGLNEDLAEAIALAHDLGHPPFGHSGEGKLDLLMKEHGGFDHNEQSLRVVEVLEESYPQQSGLNLSHEVLEGLKKHRREFHHPDGTTSKNPSLEAQIANVADEIAYYSHDLEDGLESGLLNEPDLHLLELWSEASELAQEQSSGILNAAGPRTHRKFILRCLINREVEDLVMTSQRMIEQSGVTSATEVRNYPTKLIGYSTVLKARNAKLRYYLFENFYRHPEVNQANENACLLMDEVFHSLLTDPSRLGNRSQVRIDREGIPRVVADYVAGMTDAYLRGWHESIRPLGIRRP
jgi:dGTPase